MTCEAKSNALIKPTRLTHRQRIKILTFRWKENDRNFWNKTKVRTFQRRGEKKDRRLPESKEIEEERRSAPLGGDLHFGERPKGFTGDCELMTGMNGHDDVISITSSNTYRQSPIVTRKQYKIIRCCRLILLIFLNFGDYFLKLFFWFWGITFFFYLVEISFLNLYNLI